MIKKESRNKMRVAKHERVREIVTGTTNVPRLCVFRSNGNIFAQIIDDEKAVTLVSASSIDKELKLENGGNVEAAAKVGELLAKRAKKAKITNVVFDRGGYQYHGRVEALANAARENGLEF
jgi:large subunit ribosomal protein L18